MKIAQIVSTFPPYQGGMGNVAFSLADYLSRAGQTVEVFTPKYLSHDADVSSYFKIIKLAPQFKFGNSAIVCQLAYFLIKGRYQVIHLHYPFIGASLSVILAKLILGKKTKLILHYHMDLVGRHWRRWVFYLYNTIFLRPLVYFADTILSTSQGYLRSSSLAKFHDKSGEKFYILPNGVDLDHFKPQPKSFALTMKYQLEDKKVILFVGSLDSSHYFKGVNYLLSACKKLNREDYKLIIVGEGDLKQVYMDLAESFGLTDKVVFTGYVPDEALVKYYNLCDVLVLPSIDQSEAFGMVVIEAMACAKPVIASDLPGVREAIKKRVNGILVKPKNIENLTEQINRVLNDKELAAEFSANGRLTVEEHYSWDNIVKYLQKIYEN